MIWMGDPNPPPTIEKERTFLCYVGLRRLGMTAVSVAKELGVCPSSVSKLIGRGSRH